MSYKEQLFPWCVIRGLPNQQQTIVERMRRRHDAEQHIQVLQRMMPDASFSVSFNPIRKSANQVDKAGENQDLSSQDVASPQETSSPL